MKEAFELEGVKSLDPDLEVAREGLIALSKLLAVVEQARRDDTPAAVATRSLQCQARDIIRHRKERQKYFGKAMFGEDGWEILLVLYATRAASRHTIATLSALVDSPKSTTLRWLNYLESHRLVRRMPDPCDKRAVVVELTETALLNLEAYLSARIESDRSDELSARPATGMSGTSSRSKS